MSDDSLRGFPGFGPDKTRFTRIPNEFFSELLPIIDDLGEMKAVLYAFWRLGEGEGDVRYLRLDDVLADLLFLEGMGDEAEGRVQAARAGFARAAHRGILIEIAVIVSGREETWYFLNSAKGRAAVERLQPGRFRGPDP